MKVTKEQLEKIKKTIDFIIKEYEEFADYSDSLIIHPQDIDEFVKNDYELPAFYFPGEENETEISVDDFLNIADEIPTIEIVDNSLIKTTYLRYYIVEASDKTQEYVLNNFHDLSLKLSSGIELNLVSESFIVGLAAVKTGEYENDLWGTISPYIAIEIKYPSKYAILDAIKEMDAIRAYIFEIADSTGIVLKFSQISNPIFDEDYVEHLPEGQGTNLRELEEYNEGMKLFVSAIQIQEQELKFLNFYKILEHFAPIAVNIEANELMRKKLDAPKAQFEKGDFIRSIFELAKVMRDKFNDEDLIKSTFSSCFDFVALFDKLPESIKVKIKRQIGEKSVAYSTDKQKITTASNMLAKIIYATRNKVVHAKSNFDSTGNECDLIDLPQLNEFMKEASSQTIRWYNRQPQHLKLTIINS